MRTYKPGEVYKYAHLKRDGIWLTLCPGGAFTRHPTNIYHQLDKHEVVRAFYDSQPGNGNKVLYCELYAPGQPASEVKSWLADGCGHLLSIEAFASPDLAEECTLEQVRDYCEDCGIQFTPFIMLNDVEGTIDEAYEGAIRYPDVEGVVFKDGNLLNWTKRKPTPTTDLVVKGYKDAKVGKYLGLVGAVECGLYGDDRIVAAVSGMDDATREEISANEEKYLGKVMEVRYQYVGSGGRLRHPRFVRFRDDKRAEECTSI
jgi:hypothetical protein